MGKPQGCIDYESNVLYDSDQYVNPPIKDWFMIFLDFLRDPTRAVELEKRADGVLEELAGLKSLKSQFEHALNDVNIMFHKAHNHHHHAHVRCQELQIPDLLFVSDAYIERLPEIYDVHLFKKISDNFNPSSFPHIKNTIKNIIEPFLFLINVSEILSKHIEENKTEYCQQIADSITQKNIESMGSIRLKKKIDSNGPIRFFQSITDMILEKFQNPKPLFDQERLSLVLGNDSPYLDLLYCPYYKDSDNTAMRLYNKTNYSERLVIPQISNYDPQAIETPDFSRPSGRDENPLKGILDKFLPARRRLETEFWERYEGAHCVLPGSLSR